MQDKDKSRPGQNGASQEERIDEERKHKELDGVPEEMTERADHEVVEEETSSLDAALERLREDLEVARKEVLYAKAETQNVRRRLERDVADARNYAATGFARDILTVADNLARAIEAVPPEMREDERLGGLVAGIEATRRELEKVFRQHGIERIEAMGQPLDPNRHQAMLEIATDEHEPGTVVQEMQAGYMIKDRLLRPSLVGVAKKPD